MGDYVDVCVLVHLMVCVGPKRSGCVCSLSTMKSFLKPVNNVKGNLRREVEPPSWVPVPPLGLASHCQGSPGLDGQRRLGAKGPTPAYGSLQSVYFP